MQSVVGVGARLPHTATGVTDAALARQSAAGGPVGPPQLAALLAEAVTRELVAVVHFGLRGTRRRTPLRATTLGLTYGRAPPLPRPPAWTTPRLRVVKQLDRTHKRVSFPPVPRVACVLRTATRTRTTTPTPWQRQRSRVSAGHWRDRLPWTSRTIA